MIAHVRGTVAGVAPDGAVIEVGGVGMRVQCTPGTLATLKLGEPAQVATSLVVREDSLTLYGFTCDDERNVFELLQTASGVGLGWRWPCWPCIRRTRCAAPSRPRIWTR